MPPVWVSCTCCTPPAGVQAWLLLGPGGRPPGLEAAPQDPAEPQEGRRRDTGLRPPCVCHPLTARVEKTLGYRRALFLFRANMWRTLKFILQYKEQLVSLWSSPFAPRRPCRQSHAPARRPAPSCALRAPSRRLRSPCLSQTRHMDRGCGPGALRVSGRFPRCAFTLPAGHTVRDATGPEPRAVAPAGVFLSPPHPESGSPCDRARLSTPAENFLRPYCVLLLCYSW